MPDLIIDLEKDRKVTPAEALVLLGEMGVTISPPTLYTWAKKYKCIKHLGPKKSEINVDRLHRNIQAFNEERQRDTG